MNKAKALFSGAMIIAVAGASATCWYLNDKGMLGNSETTTLQAYVEYENNDYENDDKQNQDNFNSDNAENNRCDELARKAIADNT